jgi:hypothetical protein
MARIKWPVLAFGIAAAVVAAQDSWASTVSLDGQSITVTLSESGFPDAVDTITAGPGGPQILGNTSSDPIGSILQSSESVDVSGLQVVYQIKGGGGAYPGSAPQCGGSPGCSLWGVTADDARLLFSGLSFGSPGVSLKNVSLTTSNVFDVQLSDITPSSFLVTFGSAGILNHTDGTQDLGTITLNLTTATPVPLPPALPLLLGACLGFGFSMRKSTCADANS